MPRILTCCLLLFGVLAAGEDRAIIDLETSVQLVAPDNYRARLTLTGALLPGDAQPKDLQLDFTCAKGEQRGGTGSSPSWNQAGHAVKPQTNLKLTQTSMDGGLAVVLQSDGYVPNQDKTPVPVTVVIKATITPIEQNPTEENLAQEGQFWRIYPRAQGAVYQVEGVYTLTVEGQDRQQKGNLGGYLSRPVGPGTWDMGTWEDGVVFSFDLGTVRQNWNHARLSQYEFPGGTVDLSVYAGIHLGVRSSQPREDTGVTIWLREADGSWYYVKDAVPLVDAENGIDLTWADFEEAEWVSPTNHMDEDYTLDTANISHVGIGVVNSLGVGQVDFTLTTLAGLATQPVSGDDTAVVTVSGKTLNVNGFKVVPVGLFGGYAGYLPQSFRPGCQRDLDFGCGSEVHIPRRGEANLDAGNLPDPKTLAAKLVEQLDAGAQPGVAIATALGEKNVNKLKGMVKKDPKAQDLAKLLGGLIGQAGLLAPEPWAGIDLSGDLRDRLAAAQSLGPVDQARLTRSLLAAAYPGLVTDLPAFGRTEKFILDCKGERFCPAFYLTMDDWQASLTARGRQFGATCKAAGYVGYMEFWNEPYLNWAERSRKNYDVKFYRTDLAREGGEVSVKRKDGTLDIVPHLKWVKARNDKVSQHNGLMVVDETAFSYWSGRANGYLYDQMYRAYAGGVKAESPTAQCLAGWGFRWHEDHWAAWDLLYQPTIDNNIDLIDGVHEHHYQGDTADMVGSYEVLVAYGKTRHDKWLLCYNTETNDLVDAPARGYVDVPENVSKANNQNYRRCIYNLRDILFCAAQTPDKAAGRTMIHWDQTREGSAACFGMLYDLRGRLIQCESSDPDLWVVASMDGTDPDAPREDGTLVYTVIVFNNHRTPRPVTVDAVLPAGFAAAGSATTTLLGLDEATGGIAVTKQEVTDLAAKDAMITIPARGAWKLTLPVTGELPADDQVTRTQFFSADILKVVKRGVPLETIVKLDAAILGKTKRAWLRVVVEDLSSDEGQVEITHGDQRILLTLPKALTRNNGNRIFELPVGREFLSPATPIIFHVQPGNHAGYRVDMASIVLETTAE